jgi:hypothetical protein
MVGFLQKRDEEIRIVEQERARAETVNILINLLSRAPPERSPRLPQHSQLLMGQIQQHAHAQGLQSSPSSASNMRSLQNMWTAPCSQKTLSLLGDVMNHWSCDEGRNSVS